MVLLKIIERMDDVLEAVHVVPVDVPVPQVPVARVLDVPHVIVHDLPRDVLPELDIPLKHRHLQLAQHLQKLNINFAMRQSHVALCSYFSCPETPG